MFLTVSKIKNFKVEFSISTPTMCHKGYLENLIFSFFLEDFQLPFRKPAAFLPLCCSLFENLSYLHKTSEYVAARWLCVRLTRCADMPSSHLGLNCSEPQFKVVSDCCLQKVISAVGIAVSLHLPCCGGLLQSQLSVHVEIIPPSPWVLIHVARFSHSFHLGTL